MNNRKSMILFSFLSLSFFFTNSVYAENLCYNDKEPSGYLVGFFNGVGNSEADAKFNLQAIERALPAQYKRENITYEVFYNTHKNYWHDIVETYEMREFENAVWEGFWSQKATNNRKSRDKANAFIQAKAKASASAYERILTDPVTLSNLSEHRTKMETNVLKGQKILLVGHSQGNLFQNAAYSVGVDLAQRLYDGEGEASIKSIHVAPASKYLSGDYILADTDTVINKLLAGKTVSPNITIPNTLGMLFTGCYNVTDVTGHSFWETYLKSNLLSHCYFPSRYSLPYSRFRTLAYDALNRLKTPRKIITEGYVEVTLKWEGNADLDLVVEEPSGFLVNYSRKEGRAGRLDYDSTSGPGLEHYYIFCDSSKILGTYKIYVNLFSERNFNVISNNSRLKARLFINTLDGFSRASSELDIDLRKEKQLGNKVHVFDLKIEKARNGYSVAVLP